MMDIKNTFQQSLPVVLNNGVFLNLDTNLQRYKDHLAGTLHTQSWSGTSNYQRATKVLQSIIIVSKDLIGMIQLSIIINNFSCNHHHQY